MSEPEVPEVPVSGCNWCDARIVWALTSSGKRMPLDATPTTNGNVYLTYDPAARKWRATVQTRYERTSETWAAVPLHVHHGTTCPDAKVWWPSSAPRHSSSVAGVHKKAEVTSPDRRGAPSGLAPALHPPVEVRPKQEEMF